MRSRKSPRPRRTRWRGSRLLHPESRDGALRTHGEAGVAQQKTHGVVIALIELLPRFSLVGGHIRARRSRDDPHFPIREISDGRSEAGWSALQRCPFLAAVRGDGDVVRSLGWLRVIAADGDAEQRIHKRD